MFYCSVGLIGWLGGLPDISIKFQVGTELESYQQVREIYYGYFNYPFIYLIFI